MASLPAIGFLPLLIGVLGYLGVDLAWVLWLVALPAVVGLALRRGAFVALAAGALGAIPLALIEPIDAARFLGQIVLPGTIAGLIARRGPLRVRDGWWLAGVAAGSSALVGVAVGRAGALREVLLPAGMPTGWVDLVTDRWSSFAAAWSLEAYSFDRVAAFADGVEPLLWFGLLVPLMGAAVALTRPTGGSGREVAGTWRDHEADVALAFLAVGLTLALAASGPLKAVGGWVAVMSAIFFVLEGIDVVSTWFRRRRVPGVLQLVGWALLLGQPAAILVLHAVGIGDMWVGFRERIQMMERKGSQA
jgi:hypothetical protein